MTTIQPIDRRAVLAGLIVSAGLTPGVAARESLRVGGTGMALAAMRQIADGFAAEQPEAQVTVLPSLGTSGGLAAVLAGAIDLGLTARALIDAEHARGLQALAYATTPVAFVTSPSVRVASITRQELVDIFAGRLLRWPGGTPIRLIRREPSDADWVMLRAMSPVMAEAVAIALQRQGLLTVSTDQENAEALERLPGAFGAMSIGQLRAEDRHVVPLVLDGVPPTVEALRAGHYPLARTLHAVWHDPPNPLLRQFLAFLHALATGQLLTRLGYIPLAGADA